MNENQKVEVDANESIVHYLPCSIDYDGPAPIKSYFMVEDFNQKRENENNIEKSESGFKRSRIRGRELIGQDIILPSNIRGLNMVKSEISTNDGCVKFDSAGLFQKITVWQHDVPPDLTPINDLLDWIEIANTIHSIE
eukprot:gene10557-14183_t